MKTEFRVCFYFGLCKPNKKPCKDKWHMCNWIKLFNTSLVSHRERTKIWKPMQPLKMYPDFVTVGVEEESYLHLTIYLLLWYAIPYFSIDTFIYSLLPHNIYIIPLYIYMEIYFPCMYLFAFYEKYDFLLLN